MKPKLLNSKICTGCGACVAACNQGALILKHNKNGFLVPTLSADKCIECGLCMKKCPVINIAKIKISNPENLLSYTAWSKNDDVCKNSSSGGVFAQIAIDFLSQGESVVFGACLLPNNICEHIGISRIEDLYRIIGTKYIQSDASKSYVSVQKALKDNKKVFFCGTPCQIAGLYSFLNYKDYDNLYTADLICHGVNSKLTADLASKFYDARYIISFRNKNDGWCLKGLNRKCFHCEYLLWNNDVKKTEQNDDYYYKMFASTHRYSCYSCIFAKIERTADITLGDQWGEQSRYPLRSYLGASLVLANTEKGKECLESSTFLFFDKINNSKLNAPPLFAPGVNSIGSFSSYMWIFKYLPLSIAKSILISDWRKNWLMIIRVVIRIFANRIHENKIKEEITKVRKKYNWIGL